jgi:hypothetical protein
MTRENDCILKLVTLTSFIPKPKEYVTIAGVNAIRLKVPNKSVKPVR